VIPADAPSTQPAVDPSGLTSVQEVQPILERSRDSIWSRAETIRDGLWERFQRAIEQQGYHALVIKSGPFEQPAQVRLESWIPRGERAVTARRSALVTIEAKEFHRYSIEYTAELRDGQWSKSYSRLSDLSASDEANLVQFVLGHGPPPSLAHLRLRQGSYDLWRPKNKVTVLKGTDWGGVAPRALAILGALLFFVGLSGNSVLIGLGLLLLAAAGVARFALR
jgi:hypothetical protein